MAEIPAYVARVRAVRAGFAALPASRPAGLGPPDPRTGERWQRANVLGHVAEMLPFWTAQVRDVVAGAREFGRGEQGYRRRQEAVDAAAGEPEERVLARIDSGIEGLLILLDELREEDLDRRSIRRSAAGDREVDLRDPLDDLLVGHLEAHLKQARELSEGTPRP